MNNKMCGIVFSIVCMLVISTQNAFAHVVVKPDSVGVGQRVNFIMGVPPEKTVPTTSVRLEIPVGLESVRPLVKPGWKIEIKKDGTDESSRVTEITWSGGAIPSDQKDEFIISAKVPAQAAILQWKAFQTYSDGTVASWDQPPQKEGSTGEESEDKGPYSETKVINDLVGNEKSSSDSAMIKSITSNYAGYSALVLSIVSLILSLRKNK